MSEKLLAEEEDDEMEEYFDENGRKRTRVKKAKHVGQKLTLKMKMSGGPQGVKKPVKE